MIADAVAVAFLEVIELEGRRRRVHRGARGERGDEGKDREEAE
jgi:hypothetical protein